MPNQAAPGEMPRAGQRFLHFELIRELGRGVFGRVFLARQTQLADRPVALKITAESDGEPQLLARLQHTNIVPIYAVYQAGPLQAICMPYFGSVTLARVIADLARDPRQLPQTGRGLLSTLFETRINGASTTKVPVEPVPPTMVEEPPALTALGKMSQVGAALWITARLADGLAHAHERGILHCDLKPANVLLADDGQPMLLDFNVAADRTSVSGRKAIRLGGTLPYMAPEYLSLLHNDTGELTPRSDLFSLGVVLYELLTGSDPYPGLSADAAAPVAAYLAAHTKLPEPPSRRNPAVTPAVDAIVRRLLEPDPTRRYADAAQVREDLERQLTDRPLAYARDPSPRERLRKWRRRNPRLTTGIAVALAALMFLILPATAVAIRSEQLAARRHEAARSEAILAHQKALRELKTAQVLLSSRSMDPVLIGEGFKRGEVVLDYYGIGSDPTWANRSWVQLLSDDQQSALRQELGGTLLMFARAELARKPAGDVEAAEASLKWNKLAEECFPAESRPKLLARQRETLAGLLPDKAAKLPDGPGTAADAFYDGYELAITGKSADALHKLIPFTDEHPDHFLAWYARGMCHDAVGQDADASAAFTVCITLWPDFAYAHFNRGVTRMRQDLYAWAEADFTRALERKPDMTQALLRRASAREALKDYAGAEADLTAALTRPNAPTGAYFHRSRVRLEAGNKTGADADASEGFQREPRDAESWITRGYWKHQKDPNGAIADFDAALAMNPRSRDALQNKAMVLAEYLNRTTDAVAVADKLLDLYPHYTEARAGRAVYFARLGKAKEAKEDAAIALKEEPTPYRYYQMAGLYAQLSKTDPSGAARQQALVYAARAFRTGFAQFDLIPQDPDIDPIRNDKEFKELVEHARKLQRNGK
jgi:serine/threonine protein kinase/Tfp pilus assembly protein PilF